MENNCKNIALKWTVLNFDQIWSDQRKDLLLKGGIYVWIWSKSQDVAYVGEAKNFGSRFKTHFANTQAGKYPVFDYDSEQRFALFLKENFHDKNIQQLKQAEKVLRPRFSTDKEYLEKAQALGKKNLENTYFALAPLEGSDFQMRKQVEASLIAGVNEYYSEIAGVESLKSKVSRWPLPTGKIDRVHEDFTISHEVVDGKLPEYFIKIKKSAASSKKAG